MSDAATPAAHTATTTQRTRTRADTAPLWVAAVPLLAAPTALAFFSGGYFPGPQLIAAAAGFALLALVAVAAPGPIVPTGRPLVALGALAGYCGWTAASVTWARVEGEAAHDV